MLVVVFVICKCRLTIIIIIIIIIAITSIDDIGTDDRHSLLTLKSELKWKYIVNRNRRPLDAMFLKYRQRFRAEQRSTGAEGRNVVQCGSLLNCCCCCYYYYYYYYGVCEVFVMINISGGSRNVKGGGWLNGKGTNGGYATAHSHRQY